MNNCGQKLLFSLSHEKYKFPCFFYSHEKCKYVVIKVPICVRFDNLDLYSRSQGCWNIKMKVVFSWFCSSWVPPLYSSCIHWKIMYIVFSDQSMYWRELIVFSDRSMYWRELMLFHRKIMYIVFSDQSLYWRELKLFSWLILGHLSDELLETLHNDCFYWKKKIISAFEDLDQIWR